MKTANCLTSACWSCRYYKLEGRRGGMCQQLGVPVQGNWKPCPLAAPVFISSQEIIKKEIVLLEHSLSLDCSEEHSSLEAANVKAVLQEK